jgi:hypothetical protein
MDSTLYAHEIPPCILQNEVEAKVITNDDVLGDAVPFDQQEALRIVCYRLLELPLVSIKSLSCPAYFFFGVCV